MTMAPTANSNESYCTFTLPSDVTAGGLPSQEEIAKDLESTDNNVRDSLVRSVRSQRVSTRPTLHSAAVKCSAVKKDVCDSSSIPRNILNNLICLALCVSFLLPQILGDIVRR